MPVARIESFKVRCRTLPSLLNGAEGVPPDAQVVVGSRSSEAAGPTPVTAARQTTIARFGAARKRRSRASRGSLWPRDARDGCGRTSKGPPETLAAHGRDLHPAIPALPPSMAVGCAARSPRDGLPACLGRTLRG